MCFPRFPEGRRGGNLQEEMAGGGGALDQLKEKRLGAQVD